MDDPDIDREPQDQAEVFDETHVDDDGTGDVDFEEMDPVLDVTRNRGDVAIDAFDNDEPEREARSSRDRIEADADALLGLNGSRAARDDEDSEVPSAPDEIELVYTGLMRNQRGAQASAAHWEAKRLSDEDLNKLGYSPDSEEAQ